MDTRRFAALLVAVVSLGPSAAFATIQESDALFFGGRKYRIHQTPMAGLWDYGEDGPGNGTEPMPPFEVTSSANWKGYRASWEIKNSELLLRKITGRIDGKKVKNEEILPKPRRRFPRFAQWFTGRIYLAVGDYDLDKNENTAVILFDIEKGRVTKMTFLDSARPVYSWNGLEPRGNNEPAEVTAPPTAPPPASTPVPASN